MHMIDVMKKLQEIAEAGYDNEDIQRGIVAAGKHQVDEAEVAEEEAAYLGEAAGTKKGLSAEEALTRGAEAAIVGGGLGFGCS